MTLINWMSFNKKIILITLNLYVLVLTTAFFNPAYAKFDKADIINKAVKATNSFETAASLKNYYLAQALNDKEAKEIETIYFELFGKNPVLQKVNIINDTVYSNGVSTQIIVKILPKGMQLKKGSIVVNFHPKDTMLIYLRKLRTIYNLKNPAKIGWSSFLIPDASANDKNSGIGFFLYHMITRPEEGKVQVDGTCDEGGIFGYFTKPIDPEKCKNYPRVENPRKNNPASCSLVDKGIRDSLLKQFMGTDIYGISRSKVNAGFNLPYGLNDYPAAYKDNAKNWLNKIKTTPNLRSLKCDLSEWPKVTAYFTRHKTDDVKLTSEPYNGSESFHVSDSKTPVKTEIDKNDGSTYEIFAGGAKIQTHKDGTKTYIFLDGTRIPESKILSKNMITRDDGSKKLDITFRTTKVTGELFGTGLTGRYRSYFYGGKMDNKASSYFSAECTQYNDAILHDLSSSTTEACKYLAAHPEENFGIKVIPPKNGSVDVNIDSSNANTVD